MSTEANNESELFVDTRLFKSAASFESEIVEFLLEGLKFIIFVDGAEANLLGNKVNYFNVTTLRISKAT